MTPDELWRSVGEILAGYRLRRKWKPFHVERNGGPTYKTVQEIDVGLIKTVDALAQYCRTLGLEVADVLRTALDKSGRAASPEIARLARVFENGSPTEQDALNTMARAIEEAQSIRASESSAPPQLPRAQDRKATQKRR